ncbi:MAG: WD40 repeat domain-containing protein [Anaerolineae bacterium]|nr:WD40 repeat domain-containing protein [Anaerolineae bacterium]
MSSQPTLKNLAPLLKQLLDQRGMDLLDNSSLLRGLLSDFASQSVTERNLILVALEEGVPQALRRLSEQKLEQTVLHQIASRLVTNRLIAPEGAQYAVLVWAEALEIGTPSGTASSTVGNRPPSTFAPTESSAVSSSADLRATLERAIELNDQGNFEAALPLLEQLKAAGYKPTIVEPHLKRAQEGAARLAARQKKKQPVQDAYEDVALLARSPHTWQEACQAWLAFQRNHPDWRKILGGDPENLYQRLFASLCVALRRLERHTASVWSAAWSPDGRILATGADDNTIRLWDVASGNQLRVLEMHVLTSHVHSVTWSSDGRIVASGARDAAVRLWDTTSGRLLQTLRMHKGCVNSVAWSPTGKNVLASSANDNTIYLWNTADGQLTSAIRGHSGSVNSVAWSPSRHVLASGSDDKTIRFWDAASGKQLQAFTGLTSDVRSVAWAHDGRMLASALGDSTIRLWDTTNYTRLQTLAGHTQSATSVAWSPDGSIVASGSQDSTVRLWDVETGQLLRTLTGHTGAVLSVAWSPDGRYLASGSADKVIIIWGIPE